MTATRPIRSVTLEDAPAIPGLRSAISADASDFERLAELTIAASLGGRDPVPADRPEPPGRDGRGGRREPGR